MHSRKKGHSSLEVLFACVLMAIVLVPVLNVSSLSGARVRVSREDLFAQTRALELLDCVEADDTILAGARTEATVLPLPASASAPPVSLKATGLEERVTLQRLGEDLVRIDVQLRWSVNQVKVVGNPTLSLFRIVSRPDCSWTHRLPVSRRGTAEVAD